MEKPITTPTQRHPIAGESHRTLEIGIMNLCGAGTVPTASPTAAMYSHSLPERAMRYAQEKSKKETAGPSRLWAAGGSGKRSRCALLRCGAAPLRTARRRAPTR